MSDWICGKCDGGFPKPMYAHGRWRCPWCGKVLAKPFMNDEVDYDPIEESYDLEK